ncbi:sigma 54-interacting transcriptional regulator [Desulfatirhabdium butyrativorans]|uniref:sigma 54-interacting transcriptional regulator n=1 Tax=Desulfatirhabdium butyrativorans TaxID=340467 RepID=UPI0003FF42C9|nr:sigma 54-interacting transcriptional regulator [Desulfatirhabdium butyrativorans]
MYPKSLKNSLLLVVALFVILPGIAISQLVAHHYSTGLMELAAARAENIAHNLALESTDKILTNELVALQKLCDDQIAGDAFIAYIFIVRNGKVLVHTFADGIPRQLIQANASDTESLPHVTRIVSEKGDRFIDIAYPIFDGKAGTLRMGFSETPYRRKVHELWSRISFISFIILCLTLALSQWVIGRLLKPLGLLTQYAEQIDLDHTDTQIALKGGQEVISLTSAFNAMLIRLRNNTKRLREYTRALEQKNMELQRAHKQLATSFSISQKIAALSGLEQIGAFLIQTLKEVMLSQRIHLLVFDAPAQSVHILTTEGRIERDETCHAILFELFDRCKEPKCVAQSEVASCRIPDLAQEADQVAIFPIRNHDMLIGGLLVVCDETCSPIKQDMRVALMILSQAAGALQRACIHEDQLRALRQRLDLDAGLGEIVGKDPKMQTLFRLIEDVAPTDATVLIQGESGTGKELVARAIHNRSHRANKPFVVINCSAYPTTLLESELFGHEKGAFTGATRRKIGRFEQADGGTVFLDEISEIEPMSQTRLLRVLQQQTIDRLGGDQPIKVDVRILAATNRDLMQEVRQGRFREDLFYRLNVVPIRIPPLRERSRDIHLLARHFLNRFAKEQGKTIHGFRSEVLRSLMDYTWPGNVRELENTIEHAVVLAKGNMIELNDLPTSLVEPQPSVACHPSTIAEIETRTILNVLDEVNWNKTEAARKLGISRSTLYEKMKKRNIKNSSSGSSGDLA